MRVLVAMSGGVDSSVAAALCRDQGHEVVGVTLKLWGGESDSGCCSVADVEDARRVADQLDIEHHVFNFGDEFTEWVVDPYVAAHEAGHTPNPCVECNRHIKFDRLLDRADALGFDTVATGHYARIMAAADGAPRVARGLDRAKDQSYVLHMLSPEQLDRVLFPVGDRTKTEIRSIAAGLGLRTAAKPDSQDVCFITKADGRQRFLSERMTLRPGQVVDLQGQPVGEVDSVQLVTIGQRRGLELSGGGERRYVVATDLSRDRVTVGGMKDLMTDVQPIDALEWAGAKVVGRLGAQCNAHGSAQPGFVTHGQLSWEQPQRRVAPGQSIVFYQDELVVGAALAAAEQPNG